MSRDPAFLFYSSDFLIGTFGMSDAQVGQYIRLMCLQHQKGHLSEQLIKSITGGVFDSGVMAKFEQDEEGLYYNVRLEEESKKRAKYAESRRQNRLKHNTSSSYDNHMSNTCASQDEHMVNENVNVNKDVNSTTKKDIYPILFDTFWQAYPKKVGKADALKAFAKLKPDNELMQTILAAIARWSKTDQWSKDNRQYVPMPATYIRGRRWEDELEPLTGPSPAEIIL